MNNISKNIDPELDCKIVKFKNVNNFFILIKNFYKVQDEVKISHLNFTNLNQIVQNKILLLCVSSDNLIIRVFLFNFFKLIIELQ